MAQLVLTAAVMSSGWGAVAMFAGEVAASYVGGMIDQKLFGPAAQHGYGPRLPQQNIQASTLGMGKLMVKGSVRAAGMMIWATPFIETATTTRAAGGGGGGKGGGGGATVTNYTYSQSMAVALCDGQIFGVRRIWATGRLIYSAGDNLTAPPWIANTSYALNSYAYASGYLYICTTAGTTGSTSMFYTGSTTIYDGSVVWSYVAAGTSDQCAVLISNAAQTTFTVYTGSETQTPNSVIQSYMASAQNQYYFLGSAMSLPDMQVKVGAGVLTVSGSPVRVANQVVTLSPYAIYLPTVGSRIDRVVINKITGVASVMTGTVSITPYPPAVPAGNYPCCQVRFDPLPNPALPPYATILASVFQTQITNEGVRAWAASTAYSQGIITGAGAYVYSSGNLYLCIISGISGTTVLSGTDSSIIDGSCRWQYIEPANAIPPIPTPAYRGTPYVVFYNFQLAQTGNTTPNFEFEIVEGTTALGGVVTWIAGLASLSPAQIDVTGLAGKTMAGFSIANRSSARSMLQPLASSYFFDVTEVDSIVRFIPRGGSLAVSVPETDLAAHNNGSQMPDQLNITRLQELDLPRVVTVQYSNVNNSYLPGSKYHRMQNTQSMLETTIQLPVILGDSDAQAIANKLLNITWNERMSFTFKTSRKYAQYGPTDIVAVTKGSNAYEIRITKKDESAPGIITFSAVMEDIGLYNNVVNNLLDNIKIPALFGTPPGSISAPVIIDAPGVLTATGFELWVAAGSPVTNWGGCGVFVSTDNINFVQVGTIRGSSVYGTGTVALGTDPDTVNALTVSTAISNTALYAVPTSDMNNFLSLCYLGGEFIAYNTANLTAQNTYVLGGSAYSGTLRRGIYGTSITAHTNDNFAKLDGHMFKYAYAPSMVGQTLYFKFPSFNIYGSAGEDIGSVPTYSHTITGSIGYPANVTGFACSQNGNVVVFQWNLSTDPLGYVAGYEFRYAAQGETNWVHGIPITKATKGTQITTAKVPPGVWTLMACEIDISGKYSVIPAYFNITIVNTNIVVYSANDAPDFMGTSINLVRHWSGVIFIDSQTLASATGNMAGPASALTLFNVFAYNPYPTGQYDHPTIDSTFDSNDRVWSSIGGYAAPNALRVEFDPTLELSYSTAAGPYSAYTPWSIGAVLARYYRFRFVMHTDDGDTSIVNSYTPTVDAPLLSQSVNGVTIAAGGTTVTFATPYHNIPVVTATAVGTTALFAVIDSAFTTTTSCKIHVFNSSNTDVGGVVNYTSTGG